MLSVIMQSAKWYSTKRNGTKKCQLAIFGGRLLKIQEMCQIQLKVERN
jgi:hypothetical protein